MNWHEYEREKQRIAAEAASSEEYEERIRELVERLEGGR